MLLALLVLAGIGAQPDVSTREYLASGAYLVHACEAVSVQRPSADESFRTAVCLSYIEGFTDADHSDCAAVSYEKMASVYVAYMKQHPEVMKMHKSVGLSIALGQAYPCKVQSPVK